MALTTIDLLKHTGIPQHYAHKNDGLPDNDAGKMLRLWVQEFASSSLTSGKGFHIAGDGPKAMAALYLTLTQMIEQQQRVKLVSLPLLHRWSVNGESVQEQLRTTQRLAVSGFCGTHYKQPFSEEWLYTMEWFFRSWIDSGRVLITQGETPVAASKWWSPGLVACIAAKQEFTVTLS